MKYKLWKWESQVKKDWKQMYIYININSLQIWIQRCRKSYK